MASLPIVIKYLIVFFISMVPIVELRGAIPIAESLKLSIALYYPIAIIGNMLPVPIIYLFARKVLEWGKNKKIILQKTGNILQHVVMSNPLPIPLPWRGSIAWLDRGSSSPFHALLVEGNLL